MTSISRELGKPLVLSLIMVVTSIFILLSSRNWHGNIHQQKQQDSTFPLLSSTVLVFDLERKPKGRRNRETRDKNERKRYNKRLAHQRRYNLKVTS